MQRIRLCYCFKWAGVKLLRRCEHRSRRCDFIIARDVAIDFSLAVLAALKQDRSIVARDGNRRKQSKRDWRYQNAANRKTAQKAGPEEDVVPCSSCVRERCGNHNGA